ncbi:MAG: sigma-70 family RNA polymerase sigma factor [Bacilli bacterium]|nr:sigma-70 family RNA polymerase sigma factor [Bacilli bacterium]
MKEGEKKLFPQDASSFSYADEQKLFEEIRLGESPGASERERKRADEAIMEVASLYHLYALGVAKKEFYYLDEATQQDLAQESFFTIARCATTFDPTRGVKFSTYIYPYLKKTYQNFVKNNDSTSEYVGESRSEDEDGYEDSPLPELGSLLTALTPRQKEAIGYRYGLFGLEEKKTYKRIGEAMGISSEAARVLVVTGIGKMKGAAGGKP